MNIFKKLKEKREKKNYRKDILIATLYLFVEHNAYGAYIESILKCIREFQGRYDLGYKFLEYHSHDLIKDLDGLVEDNYLKSFRYWYNLDVIGRGHILKRIESGAIPKEVMDYLDDLVKKEIESK